MTKLELIEVLKEMDINVDTISFYSSLDEETGVCVDEPDSNFGTCDLSGVKGSVAYCVACTNSGELIQFEAGEWLIGGHLGRLAGAF